MAGGSGAGSGNDPARAGRQRPLVRRCAQKQSHCPALRTGERQAAAGDIIDRLRRADFPDDRANGAAAQAFFHAPQHVVAPHGGDENEPVGRQAEFFQTGPIRASAFDAGHILGRPEDGPSLRRMPRQGADKAGRGRDFGFIQR